MTHFHLGVTFVCVLVSEPGMEPIGRLEHPAIREASGLVASRRHPGVLWVHNDSGNPPALFAVRRDGSLIQEYSVGAPNLDWEDLAIDDAGQLYIGDIGNNGGLLPLRAVYRVAEPDPSVPVDGPIPAEPVVVYKFPESGRFDAEGMVVDGERLLVISKRLDGGEARLHVLPRDGTTTRLKPATPLEVGSLKDFTEPVTGADLSRDGRHLAVASYTIARVYRRVGDVGWRLIAAIPYRADGIEAIAWDGDDLILAGEGRGLYRIRASTWKAQAGRGRIEPRQPTTRPPSPRGDLRDRRPRERLRSG